MSDEPSCRDTPKHYTYPVNFDVPVAMADSHGLLNCHIKISSFDLTFAPQTVDSTTMC